MTAVEPEHPGDPEELDVFQPMRSSPSPQGHAGVLEISRVHYRGGRTVPVRQLTSHARPRSRSRTRRKTLRRLAPLVRSTSGVGLRSLETTRFWWRDQSAPDSPQPRALAASAVLTVVVLLAFAVVRDSSRPDTGQDSAGVTDRSASIPALPHLPPQSDPSPDPSTSGAGNMRSISSHIPASAVRHQAPSGSQDGKAAKRPSGAPEGGGSKSSESESQYGSNSGTRDPDLVRWSVQSVNYTDRFWRVRSGAVFLDSVGSSSAAGARDDASFTVVTGLADSSCYSFIADDGSYLRHRDFRLIVSSPDGSQLFREDATFCPRYGAYGGTVSFESYNYPGRFLRHRDFELWLDPYEGTAQYAADSSFRTTSALY